VVTLAFPAAASQILLSDAYLGRRVQLGAALAIVGRRAGALLLVHVQRLLLIALGLIALVVPGIAVWARTFAAVPAVALEGSSVTDAMRRSRTLADGHLRRISLILAIAVGLWFVVLASAGYVGLEAARHRVLNYPGLLVFNFVIEAMAAPFVEAIVVVLYYDLRIRKEGLDLELMALAMPTPPAKPAPPSADPQGM
jgi:hypothetical protein